MVILTYRYRLLPLKNQHRALERLMHAPTRAVQRSPLRNASIAIARPARLAPTSTPMQSIDTLPTGAARNPRAASEPAGWTLKRLDEACSGIFPPPEGPSWEGWLPPIPGGKGRWEAFGFNEFRGIRFDGKRLRFAGMPGGLKVHLHRELPEKAIFAPASFARTDQDGSFACKSPSPLREARHRVCDRRGSGITTGSSPIAIGQRGDPESTLCKTSRERIAPPAARAIPLPSEVVMRRHKCVRKWP